MKKSPALQRAVLHQNRRHRAAALVDARFQHGAGCRRVGIGFQFAQIGYQQNRFQQFVDTLFLLCGNFHEFGVAAPLRGQQTQFRKLALHALRLRFGLVDFVDGHDDRHIRCSGVVDGFFRLRHHAVIRRHHQHNDVGDLRSACTHPRKRLMARRVHENHRAVVYDHFVRADMLRDAAGFARGDVSLANRVQQTGFAVVNVTHYGHNRRPRLQILLRLFLRDFQHHLFFKGDHAHNAAECFRQRRRRRNIQCLVNAGEHAAVQQRLQQVLWRARQAFRRAREW